MRIPLNVSARTFSWLAGALFAFVGLGLLYGGVQDAAKERAYRKHGQAVEALVISKSIQRASRDGNPSTKYQISYRFNAADGQIAEGTEIVDVETWERLEPGSPFRVTYLPADPQTSRVADASGIGSAVAMIALGSVLALLGGGFLSWSAMRSWRERRLVRSGLAAQGTILAIEPSSLAVNRVRQWNVRYRYRDHLGQTREGSSGPLPPDEANAVKVGDSVDVRYDSERPEQSVWIRAPGETAVDEGERGFSRGRRLRNIAGVIAVLFVALVIGESVPALKVLDRLAAEHEYWLTATTVGMTAVGFVLFMGGILYRIFGGGAEPITQTEVEDLSRNVNIDASPAAGRVSAYRFRGSSAGASFSDEFTLKQAKEAWRQGAWRTSPRWRANFVVTAGALLFVVGLFGFFVVDAPAGIKLLFLAAIVYAAVATTIKWRRA
jgi:Protein of unknown function (DUF3592)